MLLSRPLILDRDEHCDVPEMWKSYAYWEEEMKTDERKSTCANCPYSLPIKGDLLLECRRFPPQQEVGYRDPGEVSSSANFPSVVPSWFCFEHPELNPNLQATDLVIPIKFSEDE
jgi:hypothetical protein